MDTLGTNKKAGHADTGANGPRAELALPSETGLFARTPANPEGLPTTQNHPESRAAKLNGRSPTCDGWVAFAAKAVVDNRGAREGDCVRWGSFITQAGYPEVKICGKRFPAHRLVAAMTFGPAAILGKDVHHTCEVKDCTNPEHLLPVMATEHVLIHKGEVAPLPPPEWEGHLDGLEVAAASLVAHSKKPRRTKAQLLERARDRHLVLLGLLASCRRSA